ncbi:MAG: hypothetical protein LC772_03605 [Chloroflexi bacterium]|nr:hypothetical protein [Chloroflexota bacterium]
MPRTELTQEFSVDQARSDFDRLVTAIKDGAGEIVLTEAGVPIAHIVPSSDKASAARRELFREASRLRKRFRELPTNELEALIDDAVSDVRSSGKLRRRRMAGA